MTPWRIARWALAVLLLGLLYAGYRLAWGKPFTIHQLADRWAVEQVLGDPELLTQVGVVDGSWLDWHSGRLTAVGPQRRAQVLARDHRYLQLLQRFDRDRLSGTDRITYEVMATLLGQSLATEKFSYLSSEGLYPLNQMTGTRIGLTYLLQSLHVISNRKLAVNYVRRLEAAGAKLDAASAEVQRQAQQGIVMPLSLVEVAIQLTRDSIAPAPADNSLVTRLAQETEKISSLDAISRRALVDRATRAVRDSLYPAYRRQIQVLESLRPLAATQAAGISRLPDGAALYAMYLREATTTDYTAEQLHQIGLSEVARIETQMQPLLVSQGLTTGTIAERYDVLNRRADQLFEDSDAGRQQILSGYRDILAAAQARMPEYFSLRPKGIPDVVRVPLALQAGEPSARYFTGALDGSRPGMFYVNLRSVDLHPRYKMKTLAYHEGIPGHHFQLDLALHLQDLPLIRQQGLFTAYAEGWALYAERLAAEIGLYKDDPLGDLGRLQDEMLRSVRLVVDTGLHAKGWTREQAIDYMKQKTGMVDSDVVTEVQRYIAMPGQACAYKVGQLKILELRERARHALGDKFDIRAFHAVVLEQGALPLNVLEEQVDHWIKTVLASNTGPSTQTRFIAGPVGVATSTVQPAQPPTAQAMNSSSDTWQGSPNSRASAATARSIGVGPQANTSTARRPLASRVLSHSRARSVT